MKSGLKYVDENHPLAALQRKRQHIARMVAEAGTQRAMAYGYHELDRLLLEWILTQDREEEG